MKPSAKSREWEFFRDESGRIAFNPKCNGCVKNCKQSFRAELVRCPVFVKKKRGNSERQSEQLNMMSMYGRIISINRSLLLMRY